MNTRTAALRDFDNCDRRDAGAKKAIPQNLIGSTVLGLIAVACGWTLVANVSGGDSPATPRAVVRAEAKAVETFASRFGAIESFASRFEAAGKALAAAKQPVRLATGRAVATLAIPSKLFPAAREISTALLDSSYSLGYPAGTFSHGDVRRADRRQGGAIVVASADPDAPIGPAPTMQQLVKSIPLPSPRPTVLEVPQASPSVRAATAPAAPSGLAKAKSEAVSIFEKLFGKPQSGPLLAFAPSDGGVLSDGSDAASGRYDRYTAVYDISAKAVYMPDGTKLEAHSGLGSRLDDPRFVNERMRGATPPHLYDLSMRESLFHGVEAIRLKPVGGESAIYGRTGLLAHTFMLGPNGDSNGCVSFRNYSAFLRAFKNGEVKRLAVVARVS